MDENSKIEQIKKMYPEGTKIKLNYMKDNYNPVPNGTLGIVDHVDDAGQIHLNGKMEVLLHFYMMKMILKLSMKRQMKKPLKEKLNILTILINQLKRNLPLLN